MYIYKLCQSAIETWIYNLFLIKSKLHHFQRCQDLKLIERCKPISSRSATIDEILIKHTQEHYDVLKATRKSTDNEQLEDLSSHYDAVYIHPVSII